ncbi:SRPBCC domain-containing protein [Pseudopedobacter sp.]|uniref:SRPBCC domain-containing protein n=1 Tax=Pseudopedobacter sp. TaxID=1936787 RepID=UPI0033422ED6
MKKMQFKIDIHAGIENVYDTMLGEKTFKKWTSEFNPTSDFEGSWEKGAKILFVGVNKEGKREGMVGLIEENIPYRFVSIKYIGLLDGDKEITEGPEIESWVNTFENYSFSGNDIQTTVTVDIDIQDQWVDYFEKTYPKALERLKQICEL